MKYRTHRGNRIPYLNSSGSTLVSGAIVSLDQTNGGIGIVLADILAGQTGVLTVGGAPEGDIELPKLSTDTFTLYQKVYADITNQRLTTTSTANTYAGRSGGAYASGTTAAFCLINKP